MTLIQLEKKLLEARTALKKLRDKKRRSNSPEYLVSLKHDEPLLIQIREEKKKKIKKLKKNDSSSLTYFSSIIADLNKDDDKDNDKDNDNK